MLFLLCGNFHLPNDIVLNVWKTFIAELKHNIGTNNYFNCRVILHVSLTIHYGLTLCLRSIKDQ